MKHLFILLLLLQSSVAWSLNLDGSGTRDTSLTALYLFRETTGDILDVSGVTPALNLRIENTAAVDRQPGALNIKQDTVIASINAATKIINNCRSEMTVEMWVENNRSAKPPTVFAGDPVPLTLFGLNNAAGVNVFNFSQFYTDTDIYRIDARQDNIETPPNLVAIGELQHIYLVQKNSNLRLFIGDQSHITPRISSDFDSPLSWVNDAKLTLGHRANFNPAAPVFEKWSWKGQIHLLAVYCKALADEQIMGAQSPRPVYESYVIDASKPITPEHEKASLLYRRLTGVKAPIGNPVIEAMAQKISSGDNAGAASLATAENGFYNITVRDFAARMSTRDETVNTELNDFSASFIGVARDGRNAQELLTGNFYYAGDPTKTAVPNDMVRDHLKSNNHYAQLDSLNYDLAYVLTRYEGQKLFNGSASFVLNPDPAGVLTSRAFMEAHAVAGTNRRLVEYAFREFLCVPIEKWSDSSGPDNMIAKDIDRFPAGDHSKFTLNCRSCHSNMDGLRGAFSEFTFAAGFVKNTRILASVNDEEDPSGMKQDPMGVSAKYNQNADVFPGGFRTTDNSFINNSNRGLNKSYFGWGEKITGKGVREFGIMLSQSKAFPRCFAKRAFRSVCKREPALFEVNAIEAIGDDFAKKGFNLRYLFETIAINPACTGN